MGLSNQTETQVRLRGVHLCCGGCTDAVAAAVESVPGATCRCDMENGTVTLTARDRAAAQKALDAIADAGLHGETGDERLAMDPAGISLKKAAGRVELAGPVVRFNQDAIEVE